MLIKYRKYFLYFLILMYVSGAIGFYVKPDFFLPFTPFTLLYTCFVFLIYQPLTKSGFLIAFFSIALIGFVSEVIGVRTGLVFGDYQYGNTLGYKFLGVPLTISLNWALLATCSVLVSSYLVSNKFLIAVFAATMATTIDLLMEQLAPKLDFWRFNDGMAGLHNYFGWFVIAFVAAFIFEKPLLKGNKQISWIILLLQIVFFGTIYLLNL